MSERSRLFLNHDAEYDWLVALEFGRTDDGQPAEHWRGVSEDFGFLHDGVEGRVLGFMVLGFSEFDPHEPEVAEIWTGPRFDAPVLGLSDLTAGEVVVAARAFFGGRASIGRQLFESAVEADGEDAVELWRACLEAGDMMAHHGLGYTLYELGRYAEAYRHLRHYTEIAPAGAWNWCWFGKSAEAIGELREARDAYTRAIGLEREPGETEAAESLERLEAAGPEFVAGTDDD